MSAITRRLDRLEAVLGPTRCLVCHDRPGHRVVFGDDEPTIAAAPCPTCGWEPITIRVVYVEGDAGREGDL